MGKQSQQKRVLELLTFVKLRKLRVDGEEPSSKKGRPKVPNVPDAPRVACWWGGAVPKKSVLNNPMFLLLRELLVDGEEPSSKKTASQSSWLTFLMFREMGVGEKLFRKSSILKILWCFGFRWVSFGTLETLRTIGDNATLGQIRTSDMNNRHFGKKSGLLLFLMFWELRVDDKKSVLKFQKLLVRVAKKNVPKFPRSFDCYFLARSEKTENTEN